jgi:hypothetical protein
MSRSGGLSSWERGGGFAPGLHFDHFVPEAEVDRVRDARQDSGEDRCRPELQGFSLRLLVPERNDVVLRRVRRRIVVESSSP